MMTQTELRRPFGTILDENEQQLALSSDDDEDGAERLQPMRAAPRPSGFRKSLAMQQKRRRRRSSARFLRLAGSKLDEDEDEDDDEDGGPSPAQQDLGEMYKQAIQLNAENKLNSKNSWGLRLIENIDKFLEEDEMVENEVEKRVNFTKASCTLDASVKIYSYRVDDVHLTSYKVLANLNRNDENKKSGKKPTDANHDDGETEEKKSSTNERRGGGVTETLETNLGKYYLFICRIHFPSKLTI
jgi:condensin complex subunit 2